MLQAGDAILTIRVHVTKRQRELVANELASGEQLASLDDLRQAMYAAFTGMVDALAAEEQQ